MKYVGQIFNQCCHDASSVRELPRKQFTDVKIAQEAYVRSIEVQCRFKRKQFQLRDSKRSKFPKTNILQAIKTSVQIFSLIRRKSSVSFSIQYISFVSIPQFSFIRFEIRQKIRLLFSRGISTFCLLEHCPFFID